MRGCAKLADPDGGDVTLDQVGPVLAHRGDKGRVGPLAVAALARAPTRPGVDVGRVDDPVVNVKADWAVAGAAQVVAGLGAANDHEPVAIHLEQTVRAALRGGGPTVPGHGAPDAADLVAEIGADDARVLGEAGHDRLPVGDPVVLGLGDAAQRAEMIVGPAGVAGVGAAAPGGVGDVVVDDDGDAGVGERRDDGLKDVEGAAADQVRVLRDEVGEYGRVGDDHLVGVGQADRVEAHAADGLGDDVAVLHVEAAGDEELVAGAVPVDRRELEPAAFGVDYVTPFGRQGQLISVYEGVCNGREQWPLSELAGSEVWFPGHTNGRLGLPHVMEVAAGEEETDEEELEHGFLSFCFVLGVVDSRLLSCSARETGR